jgi:hypothetical protein
MTADLLQIRCRLGKFGLGCFGAFILYFGDSVYICAELHSPRLLKVTLERINHKQNIAAFDQIVTH